MNTLTYHHAPQTVEWATPQAAFDALHAEFRFTLDPCSTHKNAKCVKHFTTHENGLVQSWDGERVFMNPPYGRLLPKWIYKAWSEVTLGNCGLVVCLIPSRTDTAWWHDYCMKASEIRFVRGRIKFCSCKSPAPFPSAIVIFKKSEVAK